MISILSLWMPILLSAVIVFLMSSILHMLMPYHRSDFAKVPNEDDVMDSLGKFNIPPGDYVIPCVENPKEMKNPEYIKKVTKGPVAFMTIMENGLPNMGQSLFLWFIYSVIVGMFSAYITSIALEPGAQYLSVFRFSGCTAFVGYSLALLQNSIWYKRNWSATFKSMIDGFIYALMTGGTFGWLWPSGL